MALQKSQAPPSYQVKGSAKCMVWGSMTGYPKPSFWGGMTGRGLTSLRFICKAKL